MRCIAITACLLSHFLSAQQIPKRPNVSDQKGLRQGKWTILFDKQWKPTTVQNDISFYRVIEYKNDVPVGIVHDYFRSGKIQWEGELVADRPKEVPAGLAKVYNENGILIAEENYEKGVRQGLRKTYSDNGKLKTEENYAKGVKEGLHKAYYDNGNLKYEVFFKDGIQNGIYKVYNEQGVLITDGNLVNNRWHGPVVIYNSKGEKIAEGTYNMGAYEPGWKFYGKDIESLQRQGGYFLSISPRKAIQPLTEASALIEKQFGANSKEYFENLKSIGSAEFNSMVYNKALKTQLDVLSLGKKLYKEGDKEFTDIYNSLGACYEYIGNSGLAEKYYLKALEVLNFNKQGESLMAVLLKNNVARIYFSYSTPLAIKMFKENMEAMEKHRWQSNPLYSTICGNLSYAFFQEENYVEAEKYALLSSRSEKNPYGFFAWRMAPIYMAQNRYSRAKRYLENDTSAVREFFGETNPEYGDLMRNLGKTNMYLLNFAEAEKNFNKSVKVTDAQVKEIMVFEQAYYLEAVARHAQSLQLLRSSVGRILQDMIAHQAFESETEKISSFNWNKIIFDFFNSVAILHAKEYPDFLGSVYDYRMVTKGLLINSSIQWKKSILNSGDRKLISEFNEWLTLKETISKYQKLSVEVQKTEHINVDSLVIVANRMEKKLAERSEYFSDVRAKKMYSWKEVQEKLKKGEAIIEIVRIKKYGIEKSGMDTSAIVPTRFAVTGLTDTIQYAALIIKPDTKNQPELVLLNNGNELEGKSLVYYRNAIKAQLEDGVSYQQYWLKIKEQLSGVKRVYFSPDGVYNQINLNTLFNKKTKRYLMDEIDLRLITSSKDMLIENTPETSNSYALLIGNPNYSQSLSENKTNNEPDPDFSYKLSKERSAINLQALPGSEIEVDEVERLLKEKGWKPEVLKGNDATEDRIKSSYKPKVLHIATHGFFQADAEKRKRNEATVTSEATGENPLVRSGVLLAGSAHAFEAGTSNDKKEIDSDLEDGVLTAYEAMNLNLSNTELVVLSACETGLGEIKNGEGVYGLQRAFKVAGAKAIIMSLWNVSDQSTQELMTSFYRFWLTGDDKQLAFRHAQEQLRKKYPNPYHWGAFVMMGE